jgi:ABC-type Zn uptake system ZnuABC Zn-binding protein ZnuA
MQPPITVTLSEGLSERIRKVAAAHQQNLVEVIETTLDEALPWPADEAEELARQELDEEIDHEMQAYLDLHPVLKQKFLGHYVAIYEGKLVDHDPEHAALYARIDARYPDQFVWISKVEAEPLQTLHVLSPRFDQEPTA